MSENDFEPIDYKLVGSVPIDPDDFGFGTEIVFYYSANSQLLRIDVMDGCKVCDTVVVGLFSCKNRGESMGGNTHLETDADFWMKELLSLSEECDRLADIIEKMGGNSGEKTVS